MKKIRVGIFGSSRGLSFMDSMQLLDDFQIVAVCDKRPARLDEGRNNLKDYPTHVVYTEDVEEFFKVPMDAMVLTNYFSEHAPFAIRAMEMGIDVISECTAASTLKECVELCECVERTGRIYMLAENYPFTAANLEIKRLYDSGVLGKALYGQGEYNHNESAEVLRSITPGEFHWRAWLPRTYYLTHAFGPLMYMTGAMPKTVSAIAVHSDDLEKLEFRHNYDAFAMLSCKMDDGSLFHFTGCAAIPSPSRYRLIGERGSAETGGTLGGQVHRNFYGWTKPEDMDYCTTYEPEWPSDGEAASKASHGGGDFWTVYYFAKAIREGKQPFFDVYRGVAMSATAILGWRSAMNNGATYSIPNFRSKVERDAYRNDDLTPFPNDDGIGGNVPPAIGCKTCEEMQEEKKAKAQ